MNDHFDELSSRYIEWVDDDLNYDKMVRFLSFRDLDLKPFDIADSPKTKGYLEAAEEAFGF